MSSLNKKMSVNPNSNFQGKIFLLAGPFDKIVITECSRKIESLGGKVVAAYNPRSAPDYMVVSRENIAKYEKLAQKGSIKLMSEENFMKSFPDLFDAASVKKVSPSKKTSPLAVPENGILIGSQCWMTKNLDVSVFRNGDKVPEAKTAKAWKEAAANGHPAWCHYDNDKDRGMTSGKLYNWYALIDPRGLAPEGWRIPGRDDWENLVKSLGGVKKAGEKLKSTEGWITNGTNESGFGAVPGGERKAEGTFLSGYYGYIWTASENSEDSAIYFSMNYLDNEIGFYSALKGSGYSVRPILDK